MALNQQQRTAKTKAKREALGETELRHRVRPGIKSMLAELMQWNGIEEQAEAIQLLILNAHAAGEAGSAEFLKVPRHKYAPSQNVARALEAYTHHLMMNEVIEHDTASTQKDLDMQCL